MFTECYYLNLVNPAKANIEHTVGNKASEIKGNKIEIESNYTKTKRIIASPLCASVS